MDLQTNTFDYQAEAQQTKSNQYHGELVSRHHFISVLVNCIKALQDFDKIKKGFFYGKADGLPTPAKGIDCSELLAAFESRGQGIDVLHSIIGKATETGELLELLFDTVIYNKKFDSVNFVEEIGDGQWYDAIGLSAVDFTFLSAQRVNIAKLRARFPNKFTEYDANNRNLTAERNILESR